MMPRRSFDYAVMEKTDKAVMIPATFEWSDLGTWESIAVLLPRGPNGNYSNGSVLSIESTGNITVNEKKLTALVGVRNLVVVEDEDALLICSRGEVERVKQLVDTLKKKRLAKYL
jgi:mannose-1-phosphate guanylyltransferase